MSDTADDNFITLDPNPPSVYADLTDEETVFPKDIAIFNPTVERYIESSEDLRRLFNKPCWGCVHAVPVEVEEVEAVGVECRLNPPTVIVIGGELTQTFPRADIRCSHYHESLGYLLDKKKQYRDEIFERLKKD